MTFRLLGRGGAVARRFARRDDVALVDPSLAPLDAGVTDAAAAVADVVPVEPVEKTYRATVTRTVTQTAVVEFTALEGTDTMTLAQGLLETIPPESWVTQPADSWGYIDQIEEVGPAGDELVTDPADPAAAPAALSRRYARKADAAGALAYLQSLPADEVAAAAVSAFGGQSAVVEDGGIFLSDSAPEDETQIGDYLTDEELISLAESLGLVADDGGDLTTLSRRGRRSRRYAGKAAFDVTVDGIYAATYEAATAEDALAAYLAEQGFATVDDAAAAAGLTVDEYLASILVTEAAPADSAIDNIAAAV